MCHQSHSSRERVPRQGSLSTALRPLSPSGTSGWFKRRKGSEKSSGKVTWRFPSLSDQRIPHTCNLSASPPRSPRMGSTLMGNQVRGPGLCTPRPIFPPQRGHRFQFLRATFETLIRSSLPPPLQLLTSVPSGVAGNVSVPPSSLHRLGALSVILTVENHLFAVRPGAGSCPLDLVSRPQVGTMPHTSKCRGGTGT